MIIIGGIVLVAAGLIGMLYLVTSHHRRSEDALDESFDKSKDSDPP